MSTVFPQVAPTTFVQNYGTHAPRTLVEIDGYSYIPKSYRLDLNVHGSSDTASVVFPVTNYPDWTQAIYRGDDAGNSDQPVYIKIYAGFPENPSNVTTSQLSLRFYGIVDQYEIDRNTDTTRFACRSLAAPLITHKVTTAIKDPQITTVSFVQQMATQFNLQTNIQCAAPRTLVQVLGQNFIAGIRLMGIWDLIIMCAQADDVAVWVDEFGVLWYVNPTGLARTKIPLAWGKDFSTLKITHSPQFSKNVLVEVRTYQKRTKQSTTYRVASGPNGGILVFPSTRAVTSQPLSGTNEVVSQSISPTGVISYTESTLTGGAYNATASSPAAFAGRERYVYAVRNLSPQQCADFAQKMWRQISQHEFSATMELPVTPGLQANLSTTAELDLTTGFQQADGAYWPRTVGEEFDPKGVGWKYTVTAVNHEYDQGQIN